MSKQDVKRYKVIVTGEKIRGTVIDSHGSVKDIKTGKTYFAIEVEHKERRHMVQFGFHIWRFGFYIFAREYWRYKSWFLIPGVTIDAVNGYDRYVDFEAKILFFGIGVRLIWIKNKSLPRLKK